MHRTALVFTLLVATLQQAQQPPAAANTPAQTTLFHEPLTGVDFLYPSSFDPTSPFARALSQAMIAPSSGKPADPQGECVTPALLATRGQPSPQALDFGMLLVFRVQNDCVAGQTNEPSQTLGVKTQMIAQSLKTFGPPATEDAINYQLDHHPAAFVQGTVAAKRLGPDVVLNEATVCIAAGKATLCFLMIDSNHRAMPALVHSQMSFDGKTQEPLVPLDMVEAKW